MTGPSPILDRHADRRLTGVPVVSVLVGAPDIAAAAWRDWGTSRRHRPIVVREPDPARLRRALLDAVLAAFDWSDLARRHLHAAAGIAANQPTLSPTGVELQTLLAAGESDDANHSLRVAAAIVAARTSPPAIEPTADSVLLLGGLATLLGDGAAPALLVLPPPAGSAPPDRSAHWTLGSADVLRAVGAAAPTWPVAINCAAETLATIQSTAGSSRQRSLLLGGVVMLESVVVLESPARSTEAASAEPPVATVAERDAGDPAYAVETPPAFLRLASTWDAPPQAVRALADVWAEAAALRRRRRDSVPGDVRRDAVDPADLAGEHAHGEDPPPDAARSAAERFLFRLLELHPRTRGRFVLNAPADFHFGARPATVDLLAARWRLAVEIDGYHHFRDADAYRRDRRKDLLLQRHGYLVVRVLADDVIDRPEETLDVIVSAVDHAAGEEPRP